MTDLHIKYKTILDNYEINTPLRLAHFFAQLHHESNLKPISENLNYSAQGLANTFPGRYSVNPKAKVKVPNPLANRLARNPQAIANNVYANRMGNGTEASGDGWRFRGRGYIQLTGKNNYLRFSKDTRLPEIMSNPDLLLQETNAMISALWFWKTNNLNRFSDTDDVRGLTKAINGGFNGLEHRTKLTNDYKKFFK
jgi:putative chitinase